MFGSGLKLVNYGAKQMASGMNRYLAAFQDFKKKFNHSAGQTATEGKATDSSSSTEKKRQKRKRKREVVKKAEFVRPGLSPLAKLKQRDPSIKYIRNPLKAPKILDAKNFFSKHGGGNPFKTFVNAKTGWRTVAKLSVRGKPPHKSPVIGLFAPKSHRIVRIPNSPAHHPAINSAVAKCEYALSMVPQVKGYDGENPGGISYVALSVQRKDAKIQLVLVFNNKSLEEIGSKRIKKLIKYLTTEPDAKNKKKKKKRQKDGSSRNASLPSSSVTRAACTFHSIWVHLHPCGRHDNSIFGRNEKSWKCVYGNDAGVEERLRIISRDIVAKNAKTNYKPTLYFPPFVFRQANLDAFENIVRVIRKYLSPDKSVVELYGGVGTIGLNILDLVKDLSCSDENPHNKKCFQRSKSGLPPSFQQKIDYTTGSASEMVVNKKELLGKDICIVDPPRKGLDDDVIEGLLSSGGPRRLIYISCGFKAFKRDFEALTSANRNGSFSLLHAEGHVLFPGADHLETVAIFDKK